MKILNNGWVTKAFKITRGVRQGDPLSPYLFLLSIEPLAIRICKKKEVQGLKIGRHEYKLSQYADFKNEDSLKEIPNILEKFSMISGYKNNASKTIVMGIGKNKGIEKKVGVFEVKKEPVTILGLDFEPDLKKMRAGNMGGKIAKMKKVLQLWSGKNLSVIGRIRITKTLALSILTYPIMNLYTEKKN